MILCAVGRVSAAAYLWRGHRLLLSVAWVIAGSAAFGVGGVFMKSSDGFTRVWPSMALVVLFIAGAVMLALAVRSQGLSVA